MAYRDYTQPVIHDERSKKRDQRIFRGGYEKLSFLTRPLLF